jgi:hypothetical protein
MVPELFAARQIEFYSRKLLPYILSKAIFTTFQTGSTERADDHAQANGSGKRRGGGADDVRGL